MLSKHVCVCVNLFRYPRQTICIVFFIKEMNDPIRVCKLFKYSYFVSRRENIFFDDFSVIISRLLHQRMIRIFNLFQNNLVLPKSVNLSVSARIVRYHMHVQCICFYFLFKCKHQLVMIGCCFLKSSGTYIMNVQDELRSQIYLHNVARILSEENNHLLYCVFCLPK